MVFYCRTHHFVVLCLLLRVLCLYIVSPVDGLNLTKKLEFGAGSRQSHSFSVFLTHFARCTQDDLPSEWLSCQILQHCPPQARSTEWQEKCSPFPGGHTEELAKSGRRGNCHSPALSLSKSPISLDQARKVTDSNSRIVGSIRRRLRRRGAGRRFRGVGRLGQQD